MATSSGDEFVILECTDTNSTEADGSRETLVPISDIQSLDSTAISSYRTVRFQVDRKRLTEKSSYFHSLLCGSFSESWFDCISIQWNLQIFVNILKFIWDFHVDITSYNFIPLFKGGLYFGVDGLLLECKTWFFEVSSYSGPGPLQIPLEDYIHIWDFGLEHAIDSIAESCVSYLARNFEMLAISSSFFVNLPYKLLVSCLKHPHLTVDGEMHLSDALLAWIDANEEQLECVARNENDCPNILKQIRLSLLPLWFALGKIRSCRFSELAEVSVDKICSLINIPSTSLVSILGDSESHHLRIRLTEYSKKLNLSGCPQITVEILLRAVLPSNSLKSILEKGTNQPLTSLELFDRECPISRGLVPVLSFESVQEVDISNCPGLLVGAAIECFSKSFPSFRKLKAAYHLNFSVTSLVQLVQKCPLVCEVDLRVDSCPIILAHTSSISSSLDIKPLSRKAYTVPANYFEAKFEHNSRLLPSSISKLTFEGRTDVYDSDLMNISRSCPSLCYLNIKDCISVTDDGISNLICKCIKLHSLVVCNTSFGSSSILALCSGVPNLRIFPDEDVENKFSDSRVSKLQKLHMGGCKSVDEISLSVFLPQTRVLRSLCLSDTHLSDQALFGFSGSSLEVLDVSSTKVSGDALAHIIRGNPGLRCLKAKDCKNLLQNEISTEKGEISPYSLLCKELYSELGNACTLEEITFGWGFSYFSLEPLKPAMTSLKAINVGLGGSLGEGGLSLLPTMCPILESVILYFQVISETTVRNIMQTLRNLRELSLCYCLGDISISSFKVNTSNLRKLRLERVTPWMTNDDLVLLTRNCSNLVDLSLVGCKLLNSDAQQIISHGWPGLISLHLEECGEVTGRVSSIFNCKALEDLLLCHNGAGIERSFIHNAALKLPMLRKLSVDSCDSIEGHYDLPFCEDRYFLSNVKIAKCKSRKGDSSLRRSAVHKETVVLAWNSKNLVRTMVRERI